MACNVAVVLYAIFQLIAFIFLLLGTPIDMFRMRGESIFGNTPCETLWGSKYMCYGITYNATFAEFLRSCPHRFLIFRFAEVFVLISILVYGLAAFFGFILLCCCSCLRWVCLTLNVAGIATLGVVWAAMVLVYYQDDGGCEREMQKSVFGLGFMLLLVAWCLDIINIVFLVIPWPARHRSESRDP
ncbi:Amastin surface glycoprotein, putative, partial [Leishmania lindenbergi]